MMKIRRHPGQVAHIIARRSPEVVQGTQTFDSAAQASSTDTRGSDYAKNIVASSTPPATIALAVLLAVAVVALISVCTWWRIKKRRNQAAGLYVNSPRSDLFGLESRPETDSSSFTGTNGAGIEKPSKALVVPNPFPYEQTGWVPQIRNYRGVPLVNGQLPAHVQAAKEGKSWLENVSGGSMNEKEKSEMAPPSYQIANGGHSNRSSDATLVRSGPPGIPLPPTPPDTSITVRPPSPPTTPPNGKKAKPSPLSNPTRIPTPPSSRFSLSPLPKTPATGVEPLPSPARNTSFLHQQASSPVKSEKHLSSKLFKSGTGNDGLPLPRLMSVTNTFTPSLEDEMLIQIGDTVRMLEEYTDGWCLVQRVGKSDMPKGVVPRFCLVERHSVIPASTSSRRNLIKSIQATAKRF
ncbi:fus1 actin binding protein [Marasmius crinis-equi]|uniref:Fus1 actin binding protein n=1 Tax=Marasmius crinis-equi TaxID=585013 RepID=A0ABR3F521_9AGAR